MTEKPLLLEPSSCDLPNGSCDEDLNHSYSMELHNDSSISNPPPEVGDLLVEDTNQSRHEDNRYQDDAKGNDTASVSSCSSNFFVFEHVDDMSDEEITLRLSDDEDMLAPVTNESAISYFSSSFAKIDENQSNTEDSSTTTNVNNNAKVEESVKINVGDDKITGDLNTSVGKSVSGDDYLEDNLISDLNEQSKSGLKDETKKITISDLYQEIGDFMKNLDNDEDNSRNTESQDSIENAEKTNSDFENSTAAITKNYADFNSKMSELDESKITDTDSSENVEKTDSDMGNSEDGLEADSISVNLFDEKTELDIKVPDIEIALEEFEMKPEELELNEEETDASQIIEIKLQIFDLEEELKDSSNLEKIVEKIAEYVVEKSAEDISVDNSEEPMQLIEEKILENTQSNVAESSEESTTELSKENIHDNLEKSADVSSDIPEVSTEEKDEITKENCTEESDKIGDKQTVEDKSKTKENNAEEVISKKTYLSETNKSESFETESTSEAKTKVVDKAETEVVDKVEIGIVDETEIGVVDKAETEVVYRAETDVLDDPETEVPDESETLLVEKSKAEVVNTPGVASCDDAIEKDDTHVGLPKNEWLKISHYENIHDKDELTEIDETEFETEDANAKIPLVVIDNDIALEEAQNDLESGKDEIKKMIKDEKKVTEGDVEEGGEKVSDTNQDSSDDRPSLKRTLEEDDATQDAKKAKITVVQKQIPKINRDFFRDFLAKKKVATLTRAELEQFCLQKMCEVITQTGRISDLNQRITEQDAIIEAWHAKYQTLSKNIRNLKTVHSRVLQEVRLKCKDNNCEVTPMKILRPVGLQVNLQSITSARARLQNSSLVSPSPAASAPPFQEQIAGVQRKIGQRTSLPHRLPSNSNPHTNMPPPKSPIVRSTAPRRGIKTILPKNIPSAVDSSKEAANNNSLLKNYPQNHPSTSKTLSPVRKSAPRSTPIRVAVDTIPEVIDLIDEDDVQKSTTSANSIRVGPSQQLKSTSPTVSTSLPRLTYLVQGNQQVQQVLLATSEAQPTRLGQVRPTLMLKQMAPVQTSCLQMRAPVITRHPAPLPGPPSVPPSQPNWKAMPPRPTLKVSRVEDVIVLSWRMQNNMDMSLYEDIASYQLYAYQETSGPPSTDMWRKVGDVKALALSMSYTLTQFSDGNKYHFAVRAVDVKSRIGPFSQPEQIALL